jgi:hypothetical protein
METFKKNNIYGRLVFGLMGLDLLANDHPQAQDYIKSCSSLATMKDLNPVLQREFELIAFMLNMINSKNDVKEIEMARKEIQIALDFIGDCTD